MSQISSDMIDQFLQNFTGDTIPIRFIDHIFIIYQNDDKKRIEGDKIRELFPQVTNTTYGVLKNNKDIKSIEISIDKAKVHAYLIEIKRAIIKNIDYGSMNWLRRKQS